MSGIVRFYRASIGKKVIMAVTGIILSAYVFVHMIGNLKVFAGAEALNHYAEWLREGMGEPILMPYQGLWIARIVLLVAVGLHVVTGVQLWLMARAGKPVGYTQKKVVPATYLAQMMRLGGILIGLFIVYHILHFTTGSALPEFVYGDVYHNVIVGFRNPLASLFYLAALAALGVHLFHGDWSLFQTLGLNNRKYDMVWRAVSAFIAVAVVIGNALIPIAVLAGFLTLT
jgi:succinate dehydrogenase / fumarate reductase cytochrome b subunit